MWDYGIYDTITGDPLTSVDLASNSMGRSLNAGNSGTSVMYPQEDWSRDNFKDMTTPWSRMLVKSRNGVPVAAHMFTGRKWDFTTGNLTLRHSDIWSLLARRTTFQEKGYAGDQIVNNRLEFINFSLQRMTHWMTWAGTVGPTTNFALPIFIPEGRLTHDLLSSLPFGGPDSRTYWDYEFQFIDTILDEVIRSSGGPFVDFVPRFSSDGKLELLLSAGPLTGGVSDWMMSSPGPGLFGVTHDEEATKQANVVHAVGKGSEAGTRVRTAMATPTVPALELVVNYKSIDDLTVLQSHADADLALYNQPVNQWTASMLASEAPGIENMPPSHTLRLAFKDHPWEPDGFQSQRLIGFGTGEGETVTLALQPTGGVS